VSTKYKFRNPDGLYFVTFATMGRVDVFTRKEYKDILIGSIRHCQREKGPPTGASLLTCAAGIRETGARYL
jgi:hypothetical protein